MYGSLAKIFAPFVLFVLVVLGEPGSSKSAAASSTFDALVANWSTINDYSVTIEAHEVEGTRVDDRKLHYRFRKPDRARLEVVAGSFTGGVVVWQGGDQVVAYRRGLSFLRERFDARSPRVTSLRRNGVLTPNLGVVLACWSEHGDALHELPGPLVDGQATDEVELQYHGFTCPNDSDVDHAVTRDVLVVSRATHCVVLRERYQGDALVERWMLRDYQPYIGLTDRDF